MAYHEPSEWLRVETGISGNAQESSFANGTLQSTANEHPLEFTVQCHVPVPAGIETEEQLAEHLLDLFGKLTALDLGIAFDIQLGPASE